MNMAHAEPVLSALSTAGGEQVRAVEVSTASTAPRANRMDDAA